MKVLAGKKTYFLSQHAAIFLRDLCYVSCVPITKMAGVCRFLGPIIVNMALRNLYDTISVVYVAITLSVSVFKGEAVG